MYEQMDIIFYVYIIYVCSSMCELADMCVNMWMCVEICSSLHQVNLCGYIQLRCLDLYYFSLPFSRLPLHGFVSLYLCFFHYFLFVCFLILFVLSFFVCFLFERQQGLTFYQHNPTESVNTDNDLIWLLPIRPTSSLKLRSRLPIIPHFAFLSLDFPTLNYLFISLQS